MNEFPLGQAQKVSWRELLFLPATPAVDPRRTWNTQKRTRLVSSINLYIATASLRAGTYDVLDGMFHQKSLLREFMEEVAKG